MVLFLGLILGSIWPYHKTVCFSKKIYFLLFFIPFFLPFFFTIFHFSWKVQTPFEFLLLGGLDALTMIVPGISGTSLFFMLGCYSTVLSVFGDPITHFFSFCFYLLGMLLGGVFTIRVVEIILRNYKNAFACLVDGLLWSTAISFGYLVFSSISWTMIVLYFPLFFLGFLLSFLFG